MELQAKVEKVTVTIHLVHVEFKKVVDTNVVEVSEHIRYEILAKFSKIKEDFQR